MLCTFQALKGTLDDGHELPFPDGILINGRGSNGYTFTVDQGIHPAYDLKKTIKLFKLGMLLMVCDT